MATNATNAQWADLVLKDLNASPTANSQQAIMDQMASENAPKTWTGTAGANNPLNNGLGSGGGSGLGSYNNLTTSAYYAAQELQDIAPSAVQALQSNDSPTVYAQDIINSPWSASHYNDGADYYTGQVPIYTSGQSAANGATGPVSDGSGTVTIATANNATDAAYTTSSSGSSGKSSSTKNPLSANGLTQVTGGKPLTGAGSILTSLDKLMNPTGGSFIQQLSTGFTSDLFASIEGLIVKLSFTIVFAVVAKKGYDSLVGSGSSRPGLLGSINQTRNSGSMRMNARTAAQEAARKAADVAADPLTDPLMDV